MNCKQIYISTRAYNKIVTETYDKITTETGGIFLGHIQNGIWYVIEVIDPGPKSIFTPSYFEYDTGYVNHLAQVISREYRIKLSLLGLWHRHPGSLDKFSSTDNETNANYAQLNPHGAISGLINIDPTFRITLYHVSYPPLHYDKIKYDVGDKYIPNEFLQLTQYNSKVVPVTDYDWTPDKAKKGSKSMIRNFFNAVSGYFVYDPEQDIEYKEMNKYLSQKRKQDKEKTQIDNQKKFPERSENPHNLGDNYSPSIEDRYSIDRHETDEIDEKILDILLYEEVNLSETSINNLYKYNRSVSNNVMVYEFFIINQISNAPSSIHFGLSIDPNNLIFVVFGEAEKKLYRYRKSIFADYILSQQKNQHFNG